MPDYRNSRKLTELCFNKKKIRRDIINNYAQQRNKCDYFPCNDVLFLLKSKLTIGPAGPGRPCGPLGPGLPLNTVSPLGPGGPCGPWLLKRPGKPGNPGGPISPRGPC